MQSAPPIKDSGNDLISIRGEIVKFIQIKTSQNKITSVARLPAVYHLVILVELKYAANGGLALDQTEIFVYKKGQSIASKQKLTQEVVDSLWLE